LRRAEGGAKIVGVFRVKNHDFTPKDHIFFPILGGGGAPDSYFGIKDGVKSKEHLYNLINEWYGEQMHA
jgi:hypothetical protein